MNIGTLAYRTGLSPKMIRYYERIGLILPPTRSRHGYRIYGEHDFHTLRFIERARHLGFELEEIRRLLALWRDRTRSSAEVKKIALRHIAEIDHKAGELRRLRQIFWSLAEGDADEHQIQDLTQGNSQPFADVSNWSKISSHGSGRA